MSTYGVIGKGIAAYGNMVNDHGGINGCKVNFITYDDGFRPSKTVEMVRKLVEDDQVFAIYQLLGTPTNTVVQKYLNQKKVPQLFDATGASKWGMPKEFPWTMGWQPDHATEAAIYAKHIMANHPNAKVAMLYQNDDSGRDYLNGFIAGFGTAKDKFLIKTVSYEVTDPTVDSQIIRLEDSGADVFFNDATPKAAAQPIRKVADRLEARALPRQRLGLLDAEAKPAGPGANLSDASYVYAYAVSATMRHVLTKCNGETWALFGDVLADESS